MEVSRNSRRTMQGVVTSTKMAQTICVSVQRTFKHPKYGKYLRSDKKYLVHDEQGTAKVGDQVEIAATRPLSKLKRWRLVRVIDNAIPVAEGALQ